MGDWLKVNGEAIYGSRPWDTYGEGPTVVQYGRIVEPRRPFTPQDIRITTKGSVLYAIVMGWGWPGDERVIKSLNATKRLPFEKISTISVLGGGPLPRWSRDDAALRIQAPPQRPCEHASVMKITGI
jgi:alpha-L-fucosidase